MNATGRAGRFARWGAAATGGLAALAVLLALLWRESFPPLPSPLTLTVMFPAGSAGRVEPLITTGKREEADFLAVRYIDAETAVLLYDVWGMGGPASARFALKPGTARRLEITLPTLAHVASFRSHEQRPLRVVMDGGVLLEAPVYFHRRKPSEIYFAHNPCGGTLVQPEFGGKIAATDGRALHDGPASFFALASRVGWLLQSRAWLLLGALALSAAAGGVAHVIFARRQRILAWLFAPDPPGLFPAAAPRPSHGWFLASAAASLLVFTAVLTGGTFRVIAPDAFGEQYDWQARSLLQGRLDLPDAARTSESFVFQGRNYLYFGPTPALLRLPFALVEAGFGRLTRLFLVLYFASWLVAAYFVLVHVARLARGPAAWPSAMATVLFVSASGLGSTLLFLASRAYVYHEAIACGAMFALWSTWFTLRWLAAPDRRAWIGALACGVLAVHARPPAGLFALAVLGFGAVLIALRPAGGPSLVRLAGIGTFAALGFLSFNAVSYLKFESFEGAPLRYHVQYDAARLAAMKGSNFHLENLRHNFDGYLWRPDFQFRPTFPYFFQTGHDDDSYAAARIDLDEPTLALPYAMPALCLLALGGIAAALRWPATRVPMIVIALGSTPMALALLAAIAISHRYTGDFCATLVAAGAFGLVSADRGPWRRLVWVGLSAAVALGVLVTLAVTLHFQGEVVWGVPDEFKARYQMLRQAADSALGFGRP
ncbi:MAG: hypothetical protein JNL39_03405 [Opitutaceae bacterium]|nr:hypothetical protein [Opitutaceae bacterium]